MKCSLLACDNDVIARNYCDKHFCEQYMLPLQKERQRLEETLDIINSNLLELSKELYAARHPVGEIIGRRIDFKRAGIMVRCHKCLAEFESGIECLQHEEGCKGYSRAKRASASLPRQPKIKEIPIDTNEPIVNDI